MPTKRAKSRRKPLAGPRVRCTVALLAAVALLVASGPWAALASGNEGRGGRPAHIDAHVRREALRTPAAHIPVLILRRHKGAATAAVERHGGRVRRELETGNALAAEVPAGRIDALAREPGIVRIAFDAPVRGQGVSQALTDSQLLTVYQKTLHAASLWKEATPITGSGIGVAVLDSGIGLHGDFLAAAKTPLGGEVPNPLVNRVVARWIAPTLALAGVQPGDANGHGTHVAGIVGGRGWGQLWRDSDDFRYVGIAADANLIAMQVADQNGAARTSDLIQGLEWVKNNKGQYNIRVANISMVSSVAESHTTSILDAAVELLWLSGVVVVVSAGNGGPNTMLYPPANDPFVITVGATDDMGTASATDDQLAWFSSYGSTQAGYAKPELVAPGRRIYSTLAANSLIAQQSPDRVTADGLYIRLSGTSMSAPMISGVVAQVLQSKRGLTPNQVKWLLAKTATSLPLVGAGAGYPNSGRAVKYSDPVLSANQGVQPNSLVLLAGQSLSGSGAAWDTLAWDTLAWDTLAWDTLAWDTLAWDTTAWDTLAWDTRILD